MLDVKLEGAEIVDGTGAPRYRGDVGVRDGVIVGVGDVDEPARRVVDVDGLVVAPGFIDTHTHHDPTVFWDPAATPSPLHGVTTVIGGNCGFSIAPLSEESADYVIEMLARVEGMPLETLRSGVDWKWTGFGSWLDRIEGRVAVNAGFLVGHSTVRRVVMGESAVGGTPSEAQVDEMTRLVHESIEGGALGFSSSIAGSHHDGDGRPVPSRAASFDEILRLATAVRDHEGTFLAFNPGASPFDDVARLMSDMSLAGQRVLNWNALLVDSSRADALANELAASDYAAAHGAKVVGQVVLDPRRFYLSFLNGFVLEVMPDWPWLFALPRAERRRVLADPSVRDRLRRGSLQPEVPAMIQLYTRWERLILVETFAPEHRGLAGRTIGEVAAMWNRDPMDTLLDIVVADDLRTVFMPSPLGDDDESWRMRSEVIRDPRTVIGASDTGAHVDVASSFDYSTSLLGPAVRDRHLLTLEEAVYQLTDAQRGVCGVRRRGRVAEGWHADLVVFDPTTIGPGPISVREDLPGGGRRLFSTAKGIEHVFVNGVGVVRGDTLTGDQPGTVLRSGRDTDSVTIP